MARKAAGWMEFKGQRSDQMGVLMMKLPDRPRPALRGDVVQVPGRSGDLWIPDGGYEPIKLTALLRVGAGRNRASISAWLTGSGDLRFSDEPDRCYHARAVNEFLYERYLPSGALQNLEIEFSCQPFQYEANPTTITMRSGGSLSNPGTVYAEPVITVTGSGDIDLTIGGKTIQLASISGNITIDVPAKLAYSGSTNLSHKLTGEWPIIPTGASNVSWTGSVSGVSILPNWRWL